MCMYPQHVNCKMRDIILGSGQNEALGPQEAVLMFIECSLGP